MFKKSVKMATNQLAMLLPIIRNMVNCQAGKLIFSTLHTSQLAIAIMRQHFNFKVMGMASILSQLFAPWRAIDFHMGFLGNQVITDGAELW